MSPHNLQMTTLCTPTSVSQHFHEPLQSHTRYHAERDTDIPRMSDSLSDSLYFTLWYKGGGVQPVQCV